MSYFGHCCTSSVDARAAKMPNSSSFAIARVVLSHMCIKPAVIASNASPSASLSSYELHVFVNGQVFYMAIAEYDQEHCRVSAVANLMGLPLPLFAVFEMRACAFVHAVVKSDCVCNAGVAGIRLESCGSGGLR